MPMKGREKSKFSNERKGSLGQLKLKKQTKKCQDRFTFTSDKSKRRKQLIQSVPPGNK